MMTRGVHVGRILALIPVVGASFLIMVGTFHYSNWWSYVLLALFWVLNWTLLAVWIWFRPSHRPVLDGMLAATILFGFPVYTMGTVIIFIQVGFGEGQWYQYAIGYAVMVALYAVSTVSSVLSGIFSPRAESVRPAGLQTTQQS